MTELSYNRNWKKKLRKNIKLKYILQKSHKNIQEQVFFDSSETNLNIYGKTTLNVFLKMYVSTWNILKTGYLKRSKT